MVKFSVVIAVAPNRGAEVVGSLEKMGYSEKDYEIIIERGLNPSENRNRGAEKSSGEIIAFIDDDAVVDEELLKNADEFFNENKDVDVVGGVQLTPLDEKGFAKVSGYALGSKFGSWKISNRYVGKELIINADETMLTSANLFCRKHVMDRVKFDPKLFPGEDPKFITDAKKAGFKIAYNPALKIYHKRRADARGLAKQVFSYGKMRPIKEDLTDTLKMPFFLVPSVFLIYLAGLIVYVALNFSLTKRIIGFEKIGFQWLLFFPLILYVILNILFSVYESKKNKDYKGIFVLPSIYLLIHISYGAGMLYGYLKKISTATS